MPTGYTEPVASGEITDFAEFAMRCSRAMGALVMMRDERMDAPIPDEFKPSTHHTDRLMAIRDELAMLESMPLDEIEQRANADYDRQFKEWQNSDIERDETSIRYSRMLEKVEAWKPPTEDHVGLKDYMAQQLEDSQKWDCGPLYGEPEKVVVSVWHANRIAQLKKDVEYHEKHHAEEIKRTAGRNAWLKSLRGSLEGQRHDSRTV